MKKEKIKENNNAHVGVGLVSAQCGNKLQNHVGVAWYATQNAITLISLIITIIILLILAGVTINLTMGDEGIFKLASNSVEKYENSAQKEEYDLAQVNNYISNSRNSGYNITKLGEQTGTNPISIDVTKYDSIYVEICQERSYMSNTIPAAVLKEQYKYYLGSATWAGSGMWYGFQISKTNVKINEVRRDNVDVTSSSTITVYGINY